MDHRPRLSATLKALADEDFAWFTWPDPRMRLKLVRHDAGGWFWPCVIAVYHSVFIIASFNADGGYTDDAMTIKGSKREVGRGSLDIRADVVEVHGNGAYAEMMQSRIAHFR